MMGNHKGLTTSKIIRLWAYSRTQVNKQHYSVTPNIPGRATTNVYAQLQSTDPNLGNS